MLLCLGLSAYFAVHAIKGKYGLEARGGLLLDERTLAAEVRRLEVIRARLSADVARLQSDNLDIDYLDERARAVLHLVHPDDVVLVSGDQSQALR